MSLRKYKIMNTMFHKRTRRRWAWKRPNEIMKNETDNILAKKPEIVADVTVINKVNI